MSTLQEALWLLDLDYKEPPELIMFPAHLATEESQIMSVKQVMSTLQEACK